MKNRNLDFPINGGGRVAMVHIGPAPIDYMGRITAEAASQGWARDQILFAGHGMAAPSIALAGAQQVPIPLYYFLFSKIVEQGEEVKPPKIDLGGK